MVLTADAGDQYVVLVDRKPDAVVDLAQPPTGAPPPNIPADAPAWGRVSAASSACKELFVVLYRLSRVAPADYDFPLTRAAVKGHTELADVRFAETEDGGQRYLVGFVPTLDRGKRLMDLVRSKVAGASPQMLCGAPARTLRALSIDLRTGELAK